LLTFSEAGGRLQAEITRAAEHIAGLRAAGDTDGVARAQRRLAVLHEAARRIDDDRINDANFEKFFGYPRRRDGGQSPTA
jgi:hypothetical protein